MFTVTRLGREHAAPRRSTLHPYGLVSRHGKPATLGYYVLHEGLIGVLGDQGLQEYTYDAIDKESAVPGQATTRQGVGRNVTGGFVGITDKYWAAAVVPDQAQPYQGSFTARQDATGQVYQANVLGDADDARSPAQTAEATQRLFAGAKEVGGRRPLRRTARHQELRPADRLGLVLLHHQAAVQGARLLLPPVRQFRRRRS